MSAVTPRDWQQRFLVDLKSHRGDEYLLVACPAAGKTMAASVAASDLMKRKGAKRLVVVCPTVVIRDQWKAELANLGFKMNGHLSREGQIPDWEHGLCVTFAQVASQRAAFQEFCEREKTVVVIDEVHHAGETLTWGQALEDAFASAVFRLMLSGTPFRSDEGAIPFLAYDESGICRPDFSYDYSWAVADGVCRPVEFHAHDGMITWQTSSDERSARFSDPVRPEALGGRLRASLDPQHPFLRDMLKRAHGDLLTLRKRASDTGGLIVCDSQQHALAVDRALTEITGSAPILAMSDVPHAHEAIRAFATDEEPWLVSVRMVSEGVDIPRLGVIVWASASSTELMVRQVAGRAIRSGPVDRGSAIVHMPADPRLLAAARRLDIVGEGRARPRQIAASDHIPTAKRIRPTGIGTSGGMSLDPQPMIKWLETQLEHSTHKELGIRHEWSHQNMARTLHRWKWEGCRPDCLDVFDICVRADIDFFALYDGDEFEAARDYVESTASTFDEVDFGCIAATTSEAPAEVITPELPEMGSSQLVPETEIDVAPPVLPDSPEETRRKEEATRSAAGELFRLLSVYTQLKRQDDPGFQVGNAQRELVAAVGVVKADSPIELLEQAHAWVKTEAALLARKHPEVVKQLAQARRRSRVSTASGV